VIITRSDVVLRSVQLDPPMLSDHCQIVAEFNTPVHRSVDVVRRVRRCWRSFDCDKFVRDVEQSTLVQSPPVNVDELYDVTLRSLLNKHAPHKMFVCVRWSRPRAGMVPIVALRKLRHGV